jgi:hypothetical protein
VPDGNGNHNFNDFDRDLRNDFHANRRGDCESAIADSKRHADDCSIGTRLGSLVCTTKRRDADFQPSSADQQCDGACSTAIDRGYFRGFDRRSTSAAINSCFATPSGTYRWNGERRCDRK